jgi:heat shock protein HtpX
MTIASFLGVLAGLITRFGLYAGLVGGFGERDGDDDGQDDTALVALAVVAVSAVVHGTSFLLTRALSRYRELAADRAAALRTGQPSVLAAALTKLSGDMAQIPTQDLRRAEPFNAFFFVPALAPGLSLSSMFSTHPSLTQRLDQLAQLSVQLGRGA